MSLEGILELGTSWIGPLVIGLIVDLTGSIRWGCFSMTAIMIPALPFLFWTDLKRAADERMELEAEGDVGDSNSAAPAPRDGDTSSAG